MDRRQFYFKQGVTEGELNDAFAGAENAIFNLAADNALTGVLANAAVSSHSPSANLTVDVSAGGLVYDPQGERISIPTLQTVDMSVDFNGTSTAVTTGGNSKIISLFAQFTRTLSDPRTDGHSATIQFVQNEHFSFYVTQGAEAGSPTAPTLQSTMILLADITLAHSQTTITSGDISTARRQDSVVIAGSPRAVRVGRLKDAISAVLGFYNAHVTSAADNHPATAITYAGGAAWLDSAANPSATVEAQLDKLITDLTLQTLTHSGAHKLGAAACTGTRFSLSTTSIGNQLNAIQSALDGMKVTGVDTIVQVASAAALRAIGSAARVSNVAYMVAGIGLFTYASGASGTDDGLFIITPTDVGAGAGRWQHLVNIAGVASGLAVLDATARVAAPNVRNGIINTVGTVFGTTASTFATTTSGSIVDLTGAAITVSGAAVGDVLMLSTSTCIFAGTSGGGVLQLVVTDSGGTTLVQGTEFITNSVGTIPLVGRYVVTHSGTQTIKLQWSSGAGTQTALGQISMMATQIRP